ncbi:MAG: hypothetical protein SFV24_19250 [Gemmatimonadales bacterium]|nr:hypothetical protein [Gemmatimonadales bacterium]
MKFRDVKNEKDVALAGVVVEEFLQGSAGEITLVRLRDADGKLLQFRKEDYRVRLEVPAEPEFVKKYKVSGKIGGLSVESDLYDDEYTADRACRDANDQGATCTVVEVSIPKE